MVYLAERYGETNARHETKLPPQNMEVEEHILGGCLLDPSAYHRVKDLITSPDMFFLSIHRIIWKAIASLGKKGKPTDLMTVIVWLQDKDKLDEIGGTGKLAQLLERTVSAVNIDHYAQSLIKKYRQRKLISFGQECIEWGYEQSIDEAHIPQLFDRVQSRLEEITKFPVGQSPTERRYKQYEQKLKEIEDIVLNIENIAFRDELLEDLSRKYQTSPSKLINRYYKSLIGSENGKVLTLKELRERFGNDTTEWLINGWLPRGSTTMVFAPGGIGKTLLKYDFIYHLLRGIDWNEFPVMKPTKGLIIQTDETESDLLGHLTARGFTDEMDVKIKTDWSIEYLPQLYHEIEKEGYDWVTIDSLSSVSRFSTVEENSVQYAVPILQLNKIASKTNTHILLLHHASKGDGSVRGSSAIQAAVSQVIKLDYDKDSSDNCMRIASFIKSRVRCPGEYRIRLHADEENGKARNFWTVEEEIDRSAMGPDLNSDWKTAIKTFLRTNANKPFVAKDIVSGLGGNEHTIRKCLGQLAARGEICRKERPGKLANLYYLGDIQEHLDRVRDLNRIATGDHVSNPDKTEVTAVDDPAIPEVVEENIETFPKNIEERIATESYLNDTNELRHDPPSRSVDDPSPSSPQEENINILVQDLIACDNQECYEAIVDMALETTNSLNREGILCEDILEIAIARLSPERQKAIEELARPGSDNVQNHHQLVESAPTPENNEETEEIQRKQAIESLVNKIEAVRAIEHWQKLQNENDPELLAIAFKRATFEKQAQINRMESLARSEQRQRDRELNHVNPFEVGDTVALLGSAVSGFGIIQETRKDQCRVKWEAGHEGIERDRKLIKVGQIVFYAGEDPDLQKLFVHPKAKPNKYRSQSLTIKSMKKEESGIVVELTRDDWVRSFEVDLLNLKR